LLATAGTVSDGTVDDVVVASGADDAGAVVATGSVGSGASAAWVCPVAVLTHATTTRAAASTNTGAHRLNATSVGR
jgi:hypothetical protein